MEENKCTYEDLFKNIGFILIALSGIIQAIRSIVLEDGKLSFWSQMLVLASACFQIAFFKIQKNWQFILIQLGIIALTIINIYSIMNSGHEYINTW